jgi:hypothetical protein
MTNKSKGTNSGPRDFQYWGGRAEEVRARAEVMSDEEVKALMLSVANMYDQLAERAFKRAFLGKPTHNSNWEPPGRLHDIGGRDFAPTQQRQRETALNEAPGIPYTANKEKGHD